MAPELSIVIPAYNRVDLLRYTLQSVRAAIKNTSTEILIVDDGSAQPLEQQLYPPPENDKTRSGSFHEKSRCSSGQGFSFAGGIEDFSDLPLQFLRQQNQGLVLAKNNGLQVAQGTYVLFLDSDDLIHPDKIDLQLDAMRSEQADVSYSDVTQTTLNKPFEELQFTPSHKYSTESSPARFYLQAQPLPHSPIYRTQYIQENLSHPIVAASAQFNPIGEVWMYYNLSVFPAKIVHIAQPLTVVSNHEEERITRHWERLGVASLALGLLFLQNCPKNESTQEALRLLGENTFSAFRRLPHHFHPEFNTKMISLWKGCPKGDLSTLGGNTFQLLATIVGPITAAKIMQRFQRPHYDKLRTISSEELESLMATLPPEIPTPDTNKKL